VQKFVIIGGMERSGTNLLRRIIGSHSKIAIPPSEFKFFGQYKLGKTVEQIFANEKLRQWDMDFRPFYPLTHPEAYRRTLACYAEVRGKDIPGEKTPLNEFHYDLIEEWLKDYDVRFLQLVRNPLDVIASHKHAPFRGDKRGKELDVTSQCGRWRRSVSIGLARAYVRPDKYCIVRYEDLTADPIEVTRTLCDFLGVDFEEARMLTMSDYAGRVDNTSFAQTDDDRHAEYATIRRLGTRKHHLTDKEQAVIARLAGELARALGYEDDDLWRRSDTVATPGFMRKMTRRAAQSTRMSWHRSPSSGRTK
jgi:hypothetical protein